MNASQMDEHLIPLLQQKFSNNQNRITFNFYTKLSQYIIELFHFKEEKGGWLFVKNVVEFWQGLLTVPPSQSHPGVLFKVIILLVKDYTQLYVHICQINPNPTLLNPTQPIRLELWKALRYCSLASKSAMLQTIIKSGCVLCVRRWEQLRGFRWLRCPSATTAKPKHFVLLKNTSPLLIYRPYTTYHPHKIKKPCCKNTMNTVSMTTSKWPRG